MPKSKPSANLEHDDSIEDNNFDQFAGGDGREDFDASSLDRGDIPEEEVDPTDAAIAHLVEVADEAEAEGGEEAPDEAEAAEGEEEVESELEGDEAELEGEEVEEEVEEVAAKSDEKSHMVPKSRMDEEIARRRQLEDRLAKLEESSKPEVAPEPEFDFDGKEAEYMDAVLDGETDKAQKVRKEIRSAERDSMAKELRQDIHNTTNVTKQQLDLDVAVSDMVASYPVLDSNSEQADANMIADANELMGMYADRGMAQADALRKAVRMTLASNMPELLQPKAVGSKPALKKRTTDVNKKLEAANKQPAKLAGESAATRGNDVVDISTMTDADFEKLSDAQMKRLRGDFG
tara:strand:+ start:260 stop:1303 length:1044 start_codon:yes stop_codon:yes gene_type:complete